MIKIYENYIIFSQFYLDHYIPMDGDSLFRTLSIDSERELLMWTGEPMINVHFDDESDPIAEWSPDDGWTVHDNEAFFELLMDHISDEWSGFAASFYAEVTK